MEKELVSQRAELVIIGGGITGLTLALLCEKNGIDWKLIESADSLGGVMQTFRHEGFVFESGPNTGVLGKPEIAELFEMLEPDCVLHKARPEAANRWILLNGKWTAIPKGILGGITTPLFTLKDKLRLLAEPWRPKGTDPMETIAGLVRRRMGESYLRNVVDPFISGVYAGDPEKLVTRFALPKLYQLEQNYGSFIGGAIKKARKPVSAREKKATREVFAAQGGFSNLINSIVNRLPEHRILLNTKVESVTKSGNKFLIKPGQLPQAPQLLLADQLVSTLGAYALPNLLSFATHHELEPIAVLDYAKVVQVAMAYQVWKGPELNAFGGLIPSSEKRNVLGVLFPSSIFSDRAPENGALLSVFLGGIKRPDIIEMNDHELIALVRQEMESLFGVHQADEAFIKIFRYEHAIAQYDASTEARLKAIDVLEAKHPGLHLAGNIRDGIGIADRVQQAFQLAEVIRQQKIKTV